MHNQLWSMKTLARVGCMILAGAFWFGCDESNDSEQRLLSEQGLYLDVRTRALAPTAFEFEPDFPLWSDGVTKRRWLVLPRGEQIDTGNMTHWQFPIGTKVFKEFSLRGKLLETRLIERKQKTGKVKLDFEMSTFVWREDQSDAVKTSKGVRNVLGTDHDVPRQKDCIECHRGEPSAVLGFAAVQLSRSGLLRMVADRGMLTTDPERTFAIPGNEIEVAAIGMMHANCGHCHSNEGISPSTLRLRFLPEDSDYPLEQSEIYATTVHQPVRDWKEHPAEFSERVVPGDPEASALFYRMQQRGQPDPSPDQMPPLATKKVHPDGLAVVRAWIQTMHDVSADREREDDSEGASSNAPSDEQEPADAAGAEEDLEPPSSTEGDDPAQASTPEEDGASGSPQASGSAFDAAVAVIPAADGGIDSSPPTAGGSGQNESQTQAGGADADAPVVDAGFDADVDQDDASSE